MKTTAILSSGAGELIRDGKLAFARLPAGNPAQLDFSGYTLPLIAHDYPALTAAMWNAAYRAFAMDAGNIMLVGDPREARVILETLRRDPRYLGGGAGVGFKVEVLGLLDELDVVARAAGAVNFILKTSAGKLRGCNTDGLGYADSLEAVFAGRKEKLSGKQIVLLGAGGTGLAIAHALTERGANLIVVNRTQPKAAALAESVNATAGRIAARSAPEEHLPACLEHVDAVINTTTVGATGIFSHYNPLAPVRLPVLAQNLRENHDESARRLGRVPRHAIISDVVLAPGGTPLLRAARAHGLATLDGVPMVIGQGVRSFWILHGAELSARGVALAEVSAVMEASARANGDFEKQFDQ